MAKNKRAFCMSIIDSDAFLDMPISARLLYYDLGMRADDDGFVGSPKKVCRIIGASEDDLKLLVAKKFLIAFESGVVVIKHWKMNNNIRKDMYRETTYKVEKSMLFFNENNAYTLTKPDNVTNALRERNETVTKPITQSESESKYEYELNKNINQSIKDITDLLTDDEMDALCEIYLSEGTDIYDLLIERTKGMDLSGIKNPFKYARSILDNANWPRKR